jgi:hypothetical protein
MFRVLLICFLACYLVAAQTGTKIDLQNQTRSVDFSAANYTKPAKTGTALPPTCSTGEAYVLTTAVPGANFYICTQTNTWSLQATAGPQGPAGPQGATGPQGPQGPAGPGTTDHSLLTHLDYASSGHTGFQPALGYTPVDRATLGQANGPAKLGSDGKVLASELPATAGLEVAFSLEQASGDGSTKVFTLSDTPLSGSLIATVNGQVQEAGAQADYNLSGSTVTFASSSVPSNGARISFRYAIGSGTPTVAFATDQATGTGSLATFTLTNAPLSGALTVAVNGQVQEPGALADYTLSASTVTFNTASIPASAARISFHYGYSTTGVTPGQISMSQLPAGIPNGLATLGSDSKVPSAQLPAFVGQTNPVFTGQAQFNGTTGQGISVDGFNLLAGSSTATVYAPLTSEMLPFMLAPPVYAGDTAIADGPSEVDQSALSVTVPAAFLANGKKITIHGFGTMKTGPTPPIMNFVLLWGSAPVAAPANPFTPLANANGYMQFEFEYTIVGFAAASASAPIYASGRLIMPDGKVYTSGFPQPVTVNTQATGNLGLVVVWQPGSGDSVTILEWDARSEH